MAKLSINDIARLSGFSKSTVSKVMNNYIGVTEKTRKRVVQIITEHNYEPNIQARTLAGIKEKVVGVFIFDQQGLYGSSYFQDLVALLTEQADSHELKVLLSVAKTSEQKLNIKRLIDNGTIQCAIIIGAIMDEPELDMLIQEKYNIVVFDYETEVSSDNCFFVNSNNYHGGVLAAEYFIKSGAKNICHLAGASDKLAGLQRKQGFIDELTKHSMKTKILPGDFTMARAQSLFEIEILNNELPDAIFCANDEMAIGCLQAMINHQIDHSKVRILGFDNTLIARCFHPKISSISYDKREMVNRAILAIDILIKEETLEDHSFYGDLSLHIRET